MCPKLAAELGLQILARELAGHKPQGARPLPAVSDSLCFDRFQPAFQGCV